MARAHTGGGGEHRIFKYPNQGVKGDTAGKSLGAGIDLISDGGILIVPRSRHKSGETYRWALARSLHHQRPKDLPKKWLERIARRDQASNEPASPTET